VYNLPWVLWPSKVSDKAELFNMSAFLPLHIFYSRIKGLCFSAALTGKARHGQVEIN
jgi:hypothetical protein